MEPDPNLEELSSLYGIVPSYWDIQGVQHFASADTKRQILQAMGVDCSTPELVQSALFAAQKAYWDRVLPPVAVFWNDEDTVRLEIRLLGDRPPAQLEWELGTKGVVSLDNLPVIEEQLLNGNRARRAELKLNLRPEPGYHRLICRVDSVPHEVMLLSAPARCYFPPQEKTGFGVAAQLYGLRSDRNFGIGDLKDIDDACEALAESGAQFVGLNPLHALFEKSADNFSPYSPSSRLAWSSLILAPENVPELAASENARALLESESFQRRLTAVRDSDLVNYADVWSLKLELFEELYKTFAIDPKSERQREFEKFCASAPPGMHEYAIYAALREHLLEKDPNHWGWPAWPSEFRDPRGEAVKKFVHSAATRIDFYRYLQFLAHSQLRHTGEALRASGVSLGLYLDLALGANTGGAETWCRQDQYAFNASMGAPPDELGPLGQDWGLPPLLPHTLLLRGMEPFRSAISVAMSAASALRIDHIMSLFRLFWITSGSTAKDGAYVRYPFEELLAVTCIESNWHKCLVIGEDLGTVPDEVREGMKKRGILSYKVLYFMHESRKFLPPEKYPAQSLVVTSTHDLPTVRTFWSGADIELRRDLRLYPSEEIYPLAVQWREEDRAGLAERLKDEGFADVPDPSSRDLTENEIISLHAFLARSPCVLQSIQLEDLERQLEQANVPGTVHEHPNWRRKLKQPVEKILSSSFTKRLLAAVRNEREGKPVEGATRDSE